MNSKVAYMQYATLLFVGCKEKNIILILWLCMKRREWEEKERE